MDCKYVFWLQWYISCIQKSVGIVISQQHDLEHLHGFRQTLMGLLFIRGFLLTLTPDLWSALQIVVLSAHGPYWAVDLCSRISLTNHNSDSLSCSVTWEPFKKILEVVVVIEQNLKILILAEKGYVPKRSIFWCSFFYTKDAQ